MTQINSNTILKSILGSVVHYTKAIQVEYRLTEDSAKERARSAIIAAIDTILPEKNEEN